MKIDLSTALVPVQWPIKPIEGFRDNEVGQYSQSEEPSGKPLKFLGYGFKEKNHAYGRSGRAFKNQLNNGAVVDIYV